ncbi:hypothetical protein NQ315_007223 [Exocentrus adspersus]|uniref:TRAF3-interacting protein 1 n=1 Tax=Exocentrus adspersus TaxID=1586481 RepID=A0AAV8WE02_9CUCU|nr:hypothetical protein NQ315_007223 [Exocentrus adspersus]
MTEDITPEVIKKTQKLLGKYVKKPALTEKLLKKPPFRFLHDVVIAVIKETGFLKGLYSADELVSDKVKEKEAKIAFLNKLIDAVKAVSNSDLPVRATKIVAGLEPTKTNLLLQTIAISLDNKIDTSNYVAQLNSRQTDKKKTKKTAGTKDDKGTSSKDESSTRATKAKKPSESPRNKTKTNTPKDSSRSKTKTDKSSKTADSKKNVIAIEEEKAVEAISKDEQAVSQDVTSKEGTSNSNSPRDQNHVADSESRVIPDQRSSKDDSKVRDKSSIFIKDTSNLENASTRNEEEQNEQLQHRELIGDTQSLIRPKSARPKSGDRSANSKPKNISADKNGDTKPLQMNANQAQRPKSSLRPPSVRPSSARPGAPRLRPDSALPLQEAVTMGNINVIVESVDNIMDDEETVVIQTTAEVAEENFNSVAVPDDNKGQLVEQILEQIQEAGEGVRRNVDIDWEQEGLHSRDGAAKEINQLRSLIQTLTKTANPLGKLMNYLHEDIDAMQGELQMWTKTKNQLFSEIYKQKRLSVESNKPLLTQLEHLQEEIKKQQQEIITVRGNILRNESRIKELLNV